MSDCHLEILLDQEKTNYKIGEPVSGQVKVTVTHPTHFISLDIARIWRTSGQGNVEQGVVATIPLFEGELQPGVHHKSFEFLIEQEPLNYQGEIVNIEGYLVATAELALGRKFEQELALVITDTPDKPAKKPQEEPFLGDDQTVLTFGKYSATPGAAALILVVLAGFVAWPLYSIIEAIFNDDLYSAMVPTFVMVIFWSSVAYYSFTHIKSKVAKQKLGEARLDIEEKHYRSGDEIHAVISFTPPKPIHINHIRLQLLFTETSVKGKGDNSKTLSHVQVIANKSVLENRTLPGQLPFTQSARFMLPEDLMHNFHCGENSLNWLVRADIDIPNWPDWQDEFYIQVVK